MYIQLPSAIPPPCLRWSTGWLNSWSTPWLFGDRLIGWLLEWLLQCLKIVSKSFENLLNIYQKIIKNLSKIYQKMFKHRSESVHRAVLEGSWAILAPRWPQDGPKSPQNLENRFWGLLLGVILGAKIDQNRFQERSERWSFLWSIWRSIFGAIWCRLVAILTPKTLAKWSQVGSKIDASWSVDLRAVFGMILA